MIHKFCYQSIRRPKDKNILYFSDVFLLNLLFVDLFDSVGEIVVKIDSEGTNKDNVGPYGCTDIVRETVSIEEDHFPDIKVFGVIKSIAVETFDQSFATIVP